MISGDKNMLTPGSPANARLELQRSQVEELDVFVWPQVHSLWDIVSATRKKHYDVITAQDPFFRGHLALHLRQLFGGKVNIQVHTNLASCSWSRRLFAKLQLWRADSIRVVSEKLKQQVQEMGVKAPIRVLPIYINVERFKSVVPRSHTEKAILWVGRFEKEKDPLHAIEIFKQVHAHMPETKLVMLGKGSLENALRESARGLPVEFPGWVDAVTYLETADVVLCTSPYESYGASIIEALAAGVPVVAPDVGIAKEAGAVVVPRPEFASAVMKVLQSGERGVLKLSVLSATEWAQAWKETLV
jgi:glycosyltransferase involved in cell wall biosynthesis